MLYPSQLEFLRLNPLQKYHYFNPLSANIVYIRHGLEKTPKKRSALGKNKNGKDQILHEHTSASCRISVWSLFSSLGTDCTNLRPCKGNTWKPLPKMDNFFMARVKSSLEGRRYKHHLIYRFDDSKESIGLLRKIFHFFNKEPVASVQQNKMAFK